MPQSSNPWPIQGIVKACLRCPGLQASNQPMKSSLRSDFIARRDFVHTTSTLATAALTGSFSRTAEAAEATSSTRPAPPSPTPSHAFLTLADRFGDMSRGNPKLHTLKGDALVQARLTPETWWLEITADATPALKDQVGLSNPRGKSPGTRGTGAAPRSRA